MEEIAGFVYPSPSAFGKASIVHPFADRRQTTIALLHLYRFRRSAKRQEHLVRGQTPSPLQFAQVGSEKRYQQNVKYNSENDHLVLMIFMKEDHKGPKNTESFAPQIPQNTLRTLTSEIGAH